jgi:ADP-ribose pyrophosphatase
MKKGHYSIPKGHVEEIDTDEIATARREIKEETGLAVKFVPGFKSVTDYSPKEGVTKRVVFFIAESMKPLIISAASKLETRPIPLAKISSMWTNVIRV